MSYFLRRVVVTGGSIFYICFLGIAQELGPHSIRKKDKADRDPNKGWKREDTTYERHRHRTGEGGQGPTHLSHRQKKKEKREHFTYALR